MVDWRELDQQIQQGDDYIISEKLDDRFLALSATRECLAPLADSLSKNRTLWVLNWTWGTNLSGGRKIPQNYDTYVMLFYKEPPDWPWLIDFAKTHPNQEIILLHEFPSVQPPVKNLTVVEHHHFHYKIRKALNDFGKKYNLPGRRPYRLSSLCNKPSFYKTLISTYLDLYHRHREDIIMSWNVNLQKENCPSMAQLDIPQNRSLLDVLQHHYLNKMKNFSIKLDEWKFDRYLNCDWTNTVAYESSLINLTNETFVNDVYNDWRFPGPWFSEKTRKPLLAGNAILPVGMPGTYKQLESFGFNCDWPWDRTFDDVPGDIDRIESVIKVIDQILSMDLDLLHDLCWPAIQHNYDWSRSSALDQRIKDINTRSIEKYLLA